MITGKFPSKIEEEPSQSAERTRTEADSPLQKAFNTSTSTNKDINQLTAISYKENQ